MYWLDTGSTKERISDTVLLQEDINERGDRKKSKKANEVIHMPQEASIKTTKNLDLLLDSKMTAPHPVNIGLLYRCSFLEASIQTHFMY